jgi:hypothetical protein
LVRVKVAWWYIFMPDLGKFWMEKFVKVYGHLVYFMDIWYNLWSIGMLFPILVCSTMKNLATLVRVSQTPGKDNVLYVCMYVPRTAVSSCYCWPKLDHRMHS